MNLYDKIKSPFEDVKTIRAIVKNFCDNNIHSSGEMYYYIVKNNNEEIDDDLYMDCFDENIYWPLLENDWKRNEDKVSKSSVYKKIYDRFGSYQELYNYIKSLDKDTKESLNKYKKYSKGKNFDTQLVNKYKTIIQRRTSNVEELLAAYSLYEDLPKLHTFHSQNIMGFHFDSKKHDGTVNKENAEIKFYLNAGENSFRVAKLFLDKCREAKVDSYYFKVVDPMYGEQKRDDKLCIYSTIEHSKTFLEFLTEIQKENPDITFRKPPLTAGTIDNFIGIGTDTLDNDCSYNQTMSEVVYETLNAICIEKNIYHRDLYSYVESNQRILNSIKERFIQGSVEKGCSVEKICISDKLAERLKTVEISDATEKTEDIEQNKKDSSPVRKGPIQVYDERGNIIIQDYINPELMKRKVVLPNGNQINARQYIQEFVAPRIPESGTFKLKNGIEISTRQFIEEFVMFELEKYNGDLEALMSDTLATDDPPPEREPDDKDGRGLGFKQEQASRVNSNESGTTVSRETFSFRESIETDSASANSKKINSASFRESLATKRNEHRTGHKDVNKSRNIIALRRERDRLSRGENLSEEQTNRLNEINNILAGVQQNKNRYNGMGR